MELISGIRLSERINAGPLPESEVAYLGMQILSALREAHTHGIVHQDLKPANMIDPRQTGILLIGGIKSGKNWTAKMVALADKIYDAYLAELKTEM